MLEEELKRWKRFQDMLRMEDRPIFEEMTDLCRRYASEAGNLASPSKTEAMILPILFAHHKAISELDKRLFELNNLLQKAQVIASEGR